MDEIFETLTLIQTQKIEKFPIIVMGSEYWQHLAPFMRNSMLAAETISPSDLDLIDATDDPNEATRHLLAHRG